MSMRSANISSSKGAGQGLNGEPETWLSGASLIAALASSACCFIPLTLVLVGLGGTWVGYMTALAPYQPYFVALTVACLGSAFFLVSRKRKAASCNQHAGCSYRSGRLTKTLLWAATLIVAATLLFPHAARVLL